MIESTKSKIKDLVEFDQSFKSDFLIGTDEAGRGPGAGPVVAAAVCFPLDISNLEIFEILNDSKKLTEKKRETLFEEIKKIAIYSIQQATVEEIEKYNILQASLLAMKKSTIHVGKQARAKGMEINKPILLVDGNKKIKEFKLNQFAITKGDGKSASIAAASILAKVSRDRFMKKLAEKHPQYAWEKNKGYLTKAHLEGIKEFGITKWHRKSFLKNYI